MSEVVAESERLRLRTWDPEDLDEFVRQTNTEGVMRWLGGVRSREWHEAAFGRITRYQRDHGHTFWIVERKSDGAMLGFCGLKRVNSEGAPFPGDMEVGWRLREDAWGRGYAKEAAIAGLDIAFDRFKAPHVVAITVDQNEASQALMKRLKMTRRPDLDFPSTDVPPELNPVITYLITAEEWRAARAAAIS